MRATWLRAALEADPFVAARLIVVKGWESRGRDPGVPLWGVTNHHTADSTRMSPQTSLSVLLNGNSVAPGPIAHLLISRPWQGVGPRAHLVAAGRCNHRGEGRDEDGGTGNGRAIGVEIMNNGAGEWYPDEQVELAARVEACILRHQRLPLNRLHHHWTYAPTRKVDAAGPATWNGGTPGKWSLDGWRRHVGLYVLDGATPAPSPDPDPEGIDVKLTRFTVRGAWAAFLGLADDDGVALSVQWADPVRDAAFAPHVKAHREVGVDQLSNVTLVGRLPEGDQAYTWTGNEFADRA